MRIHRKGPKSRRGIAMVAVLLVLLALLVLCTPFLLTVSNTNQASGSIVDRTHLDLALDSAARHARARLGRSHPGVDPTPWSDPASEIAVNTDFDPEFLNPRDAHGVMWDLDVNDIAARIDVNSAPPQLFANLLGGVVRVKEEARASDTRVMLYSTEGFLDEGFFWAGGELVGYTGRDTGELSGLQRGLMVELDEEGNPIPCGPRPAGMWGVGTMLIDQRAFAIPRWRNHTADGSLRAFDAIEQVSDAKQFTLAETLGDAMLAQFGRTSTTFAAVGGGPKWQRAVRVTRNIQGGPTGCTIQVADARFFNKGTTVQITDGKTTEIAIVDGAGETAIRLQKPLVNDYPGYRTVVRALVRRPVNVNTATLEVIEALLVNVKLRRSQARITAPEARVLAETILESRPFDGFEDFVRRIVLPSAGLERLPKDAPRVPEIFEHHLLVDDEGVPVDFVGFLDEADALALYKNALNANDNELGFSTMPFSFVTRDVYEMQLRASVNAKSGVERTAAVREQVEMVVPQRPLMQVWSRQSDFDLHSRLERFAPGWITAPATTTRYDQIFHSEHPSRSRAHLGPHDTSPSRDPLAEADVTNLTFASREPDTGWLQLAPARVGDTGDLVGRVLHFDDETRDPEGRYLPDGSVALDPASSLVAWSWGGLVGPISWSGWIRPRSLDAGARFLDVGGPFTDSDRVSLMFEEDELVLRVLDGAGDHPDSVFNEMAEVRYPFAGEEGPGIQGDTWFHVAVDVNGNRPDQMLMRIDGKHFADTPGLTTLTGGLSPDSATISVESTDGFPDAGVVRIGDELIEYVRDGRNSLNAVHQETGEFAGFGGRLARETFSGVDPGVNTGVGKDTAHPEGAAVQLYGYSLPVSSDVPSGSGTLNGALGPFGVARAVGIVKGGEKYDVQMEPIDLLLAMGFSFTLGWGINGADADVEGIILESADPGGDITKVMEGFNVNGGYAAMLSLNFSARITDQGSSQSETVLKDINGHRIGGIEVFHYSGWDGNQLHIDYRGDVITDSAELVNIAEADADIAGVGSFVFHWAETVRIGGEDPNEKLWAQTMVIPISLPVTGGTGSFGFLTPGTNNSQFAQITRLDDETEMTEWVRYDEVVNGQLVRDENNALRAARFAAQGGRFEAEADGTRPVGGGGGGTGGGTSGGAGGIGGSGTGGSGGGSGGGTGGSAGGVGGSGTGGDGVWMTISAPPPAVPMITTMTPAAAGAYWDYDLGEAEDDDLPVTQATRSALQFRGVLGTYSHEHGAGTLVLPVWKTTSGGLTRGRPGRLDWVMLFDDDVTLPGWPARFHFTHRPREHTVHSWREVAGTPLSAEAGESAVLTQTGMQLGVTYVALQASPGVPITAGTSSTSSGSTQGVIDTRQWARVSKFPSGELPREVNRVLVGGDFRGGRGSQVPSAVVDELVFQNSRFGQSMGHAEDTLGGQLVLREPLLQGRHDLELFHHTLRTPWGDTAFQANPLSELPEEGGVLRIDDEIVFYESVDAQNDLILLAEQGRGLLGTEENRHAEHAGVTRLESIRATILTAGVQADSALLSVASVRDFPERGTVLIDDELLHYDRIEGNALAMARASQIPGAMDDAGPGLFRGRYGTVRNAHAAGAVVILFPIRYWDRWAPRADAPELHYFGMHAAQDAAFWRSIFWEVEDAAAAGPRFGVLLRTDPDTPWDEDPDAVAELEELWQGTREGEPNPIGVQSDRIDWRFFVEHQNASFDPRLGTASGWKMTPRLRMSGVEYVGPSLVLRRVDR